MDRELFFQLLRGIVPGTLAGALLLLLTFWRNRPTPEPNTTSWRVVLAIMALGAILMGCFAIAFPLRTPSGLFDWLGWLPIPIAMIGLGIALAPWRIGVLLVALFGLLIGILFTSRSTWTGSDAKVLLLALASATSFAALLHPVWSTRPLLTLAVAILSAGGMSQVLVLGFHALKLGQVAGIGASALGGIAIGALILTLLRRNLPPIAPLIIMAGLFAAAAMTQGSAVTETVDDWILTLYLTTIPIAGTVVMCFLKHFRKEQNTILVWIITLLIAAAPVRNAISLIIDNRSESTSGY